MSFYIADLNAITKKNDNYKVINETIKKFPKANHFELMLNNFIYTINNNKLRKEHYKFCLEQSLLISKIKNG